MATTSVYELPYQELTDAPNGASLGEDLAEAVETELVRIDDALNTVEAKVTTLQAGVAQVSVDNDSVGSIEVVFDTPFTTAPVVATSWQTNNFYWITGVTNVTPAGFTAVITRKDGVVTSGGPFPVGWVAMVATQ